MLKKYAFSVLLILILALASFSSALAGTGVFPVEPLTPAPTVEVGDMAAENSPFWYVELSGGSSVDGVSLGKLNTQHANFRAAAAKLGIKFTERTSFTTLWNGFSIVADASQLSKIKSLPGVIGIYPVQIIKMPETTPGNPDLFTALTMTGADIVQSELGFTGAGIKVGIIDTGIDVNHPAFGGDGVAEMNSHFWYSSPRILYGRDFVGDDYDGYNTPVPDPIPDDCAGHGTHVAGIVGANDATNGMKGVAPDVIFGAYRVFGCAGVTQDDVMLSAMEHAYKDGMQVINMSIGSAFEWAQSPTAVAASKLVSKGMVVVASIGNSGTSGLYAAGAPGLGRNVIGVASYDNTSVYLPYFEVNGTHIGYVPMTFSPAPPTSGTEEIVYVGRACNVDTLAADPTGKVALAIRGTCSFGEKALKAINAGATAVVIYNNTAGIVNGTLGASLGSPVSVVGISLADGLLIRAQSVPTSMTWTDQMDSFTSPTGGLISSFSSYGLSPELDIKPDLGAPGGNIYSSYPLELGGYATLSGTSMSSPHVAGAAALFLQARPSVKAIDVKTYLLNSALPKDWWGYPGVGYLEPVARQGAGMLQIDKAILSTSVVTPAKIATGESQKGPFKQVLTIKNNSSHSVRYSFDYESAISVANTYPPHSYWEGDDYVNFSSGGLSLRAGYTGTVTATIYPSTGPDAALYGGYIVISGNDGSVMRVPYAGFVGDYQSIQALSSSYGLPWLVDIDWNDPVAPFSLTGDDFPHLVIQFSHPVAKVLVEVRNASTHQYVNKNFKYGMVFNWVPRNATTSTVYDFVWDGTLMKDVFPTSSIVNYKYVNDGTYYLVVKSLKALGIAANPADWETWTSPDFVIDRP
jgi:minor extracellular serine protease Vpr